MLSEAFEVLYYWFIVNEVIVLLFDSLSGSKNLSALLDALMKEHANLL